MGKKETSDNGKWKGLAAAAFCLLIVVTVLYAMAAVRLYADKNTVALSVQPDGQETLEISGLEALSMWNEGHGARDALIEYAEAVTDESNPDFIPVDRRIAVFDFDGTLFCETDPNYFDYTMLVYRVLEDPDYVDLASDFEREVANDIVALNETGTASADLPVRHGMAVASAFAGMTLEEFDDYIRMFSEQAMPSYTGMNRGYGFYLPMIQIIDYLEANDFTVFIISGTDRLIVRSIVECYGLDIPNSRIIGSDELIIASGQGDEDGLDYRFTADDTPILGGEFLRKNLQENKVEIIVREIGLQPVLSFGNSSGDYSMATYTVNNNPYRSLAFMLCCDDLVRENGNLDKADKMYAACDENGWIPVSMADDWNTIYGPSVVYTGATVTAD